MVNGDSLEGDNGIWKRGGESDRERNKGIGVGEEDVEIIALQ